MHCCFGGGAAGDDVWYEHAHAGLGRVVVGEDFVVGEVEAEGVAEEEDR